MARTLDEYRHKLIDKILLAESSRDVLRFSDTALRSLNEHDVHSYIIVRFIDKTLMNLEEVSALRIGEKQQSNIKSAIDHFVHVRRKYQNNTVS
jgi:hypothetical protein